jgi:thimet oligopeptidase
MFLSVAFRSLLLAFFVLGTGRAGEPSFWRMPATVAELQQQAETHIAAARRERRQLLAVSGKRTVDNTLQHYENFFREIDAVQQACAIGENLHPDPAFRAAAAQIHQKMAVLRTEMILDSQVYQALAGIDRSHIDPAAGYYLQRTLDVLRQSGMDQPDSVRAQIRDTEVELTRLEQEYSRHLVETRVTWPVPVRRFTGVPADIIDRLPRDPNGNVILSTDFNNLQILTFAEDSELRRDLLVRFGNVGYPSNTETIRNLLRARQKRAELSGFPNYAALQLTEYMAGTVETVRSFIARLEQASRAPLQRDVALLLVEKQKIVPGAQRVDPWDEPYLARRIAIEKDSFDAKDVRPYFSLERVQAGVFGIAQRLFAVSLQQVQGVPLWHPSVTCWNLVQGGRVIGRVYLDLYSRPGKNPHPGVTRVLRMGDPGGTLPEMSLAMNFAQPGKSNPTLLSEFEAQTFLHEFGHVLALVFAGQHRWAGSGFERDFAEAPSQLLEEWMLDPKVLATFARHYQTGETIPADLVRRMARAEGIDRGIYARFSSGGADLSLSLHDGSVGGADLAQFSRQLVSKYLPGLDAYHAECDFPFLAFRPYASTYYTYLWSQVILRDLLTRFRSDDLLDPVPAKRYREIILDRAGTAPAAKLVEDFLGRPFNTEAYEAWLNADAGNHPDISPRSAP